VVQRQRKACGKFIDSKNLTIRYVLHRTKCNLRKPPLSPHFHDRRAIHRKAHDLSQTPQTEIPAKPHPTTFPPGEQSKESPNRLQPKKSSNLLLSPLAALSSVLTRRATQRESALAGNCDLREARNLVLYSCILFTFLFLGFDC
jgi:hypothetical protein